MRFVGLKRFSSSFATKANNTRVVDILPNRLTTKKSSLCSLPASKFLSLPASYAWEFPVFYERFHRKSLGPGSVYDWVETFNNSSRINAVGFLALTLYHDEASFSHKRFQDWFEKMTNNLGSQSRMPAAKKLLDLLILQLINQDASWMSMEKALDFCHIFKGFLPPSTFRAFQLDLLELMTKKAAICNYPVHAYICLQRAAIAGFPISKAILEMGLTCMLKYNLIEEANSLLTLHNGFPQYQRFRRFYWNCIFYSFCNGTRNPVLALKYLKILETSYGIGCSENGNLVWDYWLTVLRMGLKLKARDLISDAFRHLGPNTIGKEIDVWTLMLGTPEFDDEIYNILKPFILETTKKRYDPMDATFNEYLGLVINGYNFDDNSKLQNVQRMLTLLINRQIDLETSKRPITDLISVITCYLFRDPINVDADFTMAYINSLKAIRVSCLNAQAFIRLQNHVKFLGRDASSLILLLNSELSESVPSQPQPLSSSYSLSYCRDHCQRLFQTSSI